MTTVTRIGSFSPPTNPFFSRLSCDFRFPSLSLSLVISLCFDIRRLSGARSLSQPPPSLSRYQDSLSPFLSLSLFLSLSISLSFSNFLSFSLFLSSRNFRVSPETQIYNPINTKLLVSRSSCPLHPLLQEHASARERGRTHEACDIYECVRIL